MKPEEKEKSHGEDEDLLNKYALVRKTVTCRHEGGGGSYACMKKGRGRHQCVIWRDGKN